MASQHKSVYFNVATERGLLDFAGSLPNFSNWVKEQIRQHITTQEVERRTNEKLAEIISQPEKRSVWNFPK